MIKTKKPIARILIIVALVLCMSFAMPTMDAFALNLADMTVGVDAGTIRVYYSDTLSSCTYSSGSLSPGLSLSYIPNDGIYLKGTPTAEGSYSASYTVTTANGVETLTLNFNVRSASYNVPESEYLPVSTPSPTKTPQPAGTAPKITKHPTGETVEVGGAAKFIARADNATKFTWRIVSKDTTCTYKATEAEYYFPGLVVSGEDTDTLILSSIPASMDSWSVECMFQNTYGNSFTNGAIITVVKNEPAPTPIPTKAPAQNNNNNTNTNTQPDENIPTTGSGKTANITTQPKSTQVEKGQTVTLSAYATSPNNGDVSYQWYSAPVNDINAALPIGGATEEKYTVTPSEDTVYYWAAVWNTKEGIRSDAVFTQAAAVSLVPEPTPVPTPTPTPVPTPSDDGSSFLSGNMQLVLFGVIGLLALAALIGVVIYLRIESKREDE